MPYGPYLLQMNWVLQGELSKQKLELTPKLLANLRRRWQLENMVRPLHGLNTTFLTTLDRWLQRELSKHRLQLNSRLLTNPNRGLSM